MSAKIASFIETIIQRNQKNAQNPKPPITNANYVKHEDKDKSHGYSAQLHRELSNHSCTVHSCKSPNTIAQYKFNCSVHENCHLLNECFDIFRYWYIYTLMYSFSVDISCQPHCGHRLFEVFIKSGRNATAWGPTHVLAKITHKKKVYWDLFQS